MNDTTTDEQTFGIDIDGSIDNQALTRTATVSELEQIAAALRSDADDISRMARTIAGGSNEEKTVYGSYLTVSVFK